MKKRRTSVLLDEESIEAVCIAELGQNNSVIREHTGVCKRTGAPLTDGQIQYRMTQAKALAGLDRGDGFRKQWREGRSTIAQHFRRQAVPILRKEYQHTIAQQIERPAPKTINVESFEAGQAARRARGRRLGLKPEAP
jgi:hypothetical protein